ncbi:HNH endonuclease signature motif containing protein [Sphingomonas oligophenolica]|uniref:HNH endonuclease signature motif containing protein n=1 Tax=Sphingomonas oligophenolica TaxID=301154 RepID=UPI00138766C8|nr:HNH endonuclease signature motif containing protein [Sphingomonas oligophenolica]
MANQPYNQDRPAIPAALRRDVLVEAGHRCAVAGCGEHTYLEIHHIDHDRENNRLENLILLCRKHHSMAHADVIDRTALRQYKERLKAAELTEIHRRLVELEQLVTGTTQHMPKVVETEDQPDAGTAVKSAPRRFEVLYFALYQVAISKLEKDMGTYFERNVEFASGKGRLILDGLRPREGKPDLLVDVHYFRKAFQDGSAYGQLVERKVALYELLTGRPAEGIMLAIVGRESMLAEEALPLTRAGVAAIECVSLHVYSCEQVGFHPGPVSAGVL